MQNKEKSKKEKEAVINAARTCIFEENIEAAKNASCSECPCDEPNCPRHGKCVECQKYHREHPECGSTACGK